MFIRMAAALLAILISSSAFAQINEDKLGGWYMYMWNKDLDNSRFGFQGDVQYRNWDAIGDLEQLLIRGGATWRPRDSNIKLTLGLAHITSGAYNSSRTVSKERRLYQEALVPQRLGRRAYFTHRFRLEQRDVDGQNTRNRFRYFVGLNYPLNQDSLGPGALYLSFYNELFINLERDIGGERRVDHYDRNRAYAALGYSLSDRSRIQFGYMYQDTDDWGKGQLQFNLIQNF